jgi:SAM-dependent methyltransferase
VLDVGSRDVNGSVRPLIEQLGASYYCGVDIEPGPGVDELCSAEALVSRFGVEAFDIVVSTEMLEHVRDWRAAISNMKRVLEAGGRPARDNPVARLLLHGYPYDFWRYESDDMRRIFSDFEIAALEPNPIAPGIFVKARKPTGWEPAPLDDVRLWSVIGKRRVADVSRHAGQALMARRRLRARVAPFVPASVRRLIRARRGT